MTSRTRTCSCSSTTSSASPRPAPRCPPSSAAWPRPWATSPPWPTRWATSRSASPRCKGKSITSVQAVYVPADDYTDPAPFTAFTHFDATTNLSRDVFAKGIFPAVDPLAVDLPHPAARHRRRARTTTWPAGWCRSCSATRSSRTSSPSSASTSSPKRTSCSWAGPARSRSSSASRCTPASPSPASPAPSCRRRDRRGLRASSPTGEFDDIPEAGLHRRRRHRRPA